MNLNSIKKVDLKKGEIIILRTERYLSEKEVDQIKKNVKKIFQGNRIVVLTEGLSLSVVRKIGDDKLIKLIKRYEKELEGLNFSAVDGSTELERVIKDLKNLIK